MGKELPSDAAGYVEKRLSWEKYLGCDSEVAIEAYKIYLNRAAKGKEGTEEQDWIRAESIVRNRFARELIHKLTT
ncbi:MAG: hypothetical protein UU51_C0001G0029 [Microgenomates group bacterium GW2011_GWC1_41_20]|uniref:DUF2934 domain-containing protein n=7 Tax=Candidatus Woeseibacteriota TaxID=1752722 RepID=A0A0G0WUR3_9BACT|nr:MAG: hypothetical protein UU39_C0010G0027 [Candidatus Woesebacteria bacterium GW2011_GWD1_41_12]KKS00770.1 MAG: hypothetical protein UU51_C0001G0029 [Microgenomates group bacterium GW2011_GWC1_41_20]KKS05791.1 MAG: hypothetical protein UU57_C0001G0056 [Candidatus Woesebacteria bacterium GW2011_GWE1_41_24]KKS16534.1 MAG: hypothetical protein UU74_C0040G0010 [Candidatus Woesebacteria bacterium GW2011_GWA1_41_7]OGM81300.1 MAG: hypothetical protein A2393_03500 [Candidatus Woesebacteria bacterium